MNECLEVTIENMIDGEYGFAVPWSMLRDEHDRYHLIRKKRMMKQPEKEFKLQVFKYEGKYYIDSSLCQFIWNKQILSDSDEDNLLVPVYQISSSGITRIFNKMT